jgi:hypothetical protein
MRLIRNIVFALVALAFASSSMFAQRTTARSSSSSSTQRTLWEIGADGGLGLELSVPAGGSKTTSLQIPLSSIRAGFFINDQWSLEPSFRYVFAKTEGTPSASFYTLGFAGLYHLSTNRTHRQAYLRPFLNVLGFSGGGASDSDTELGFGVGMKWPKLNGRMAWRGEVNLARQMDAEVTAINLLWGISFFTR